MINFGYILMGEHFLYLGRVCQATPHTKIGCCNPDTTAIDINTMEGVYINGMAQVERLRTFRANPDVAEHIKKIDETAVILHDPTMKVWSDKFKVRPLITDRFVEYEEDDTWLLYFGLAEKIVVPYYEEYDGNQWVAKD